MTRLKEFRSQLAGHPEPSPPASPTWGRSADDESSDNGLVVMLICHFDETNPLGGLEGQAGLLSETLTGLGESVVVLSSTRSLRRTGGRDTAAGRVHLFWTYASPQVSGRYLPAALLWAVQILIWIVLNRRRIAVIHGHQIRIHAFVSAWATKVMRIPSILKSATGGAGADIRAIGSRKYLGAPGRAYIIRNTSAFIATTRSIRDDLLQHGVPAERIHVIPNGVARSGNRVQPGLEAHRRCVFLGRLAEDKNALRLTRVACREAGPLRLSLDIYGRGEEQAQVEAAVRQQVDPRVTYAGYCEEPIHILPGYGWLLLPSDAEGLSNAMLEAMTVGVVPVTTRVSGCVDHIVDGANGYFFEGVDDRSLADGLVRIAQTSTADWQKMSDRARDYAHRAFDIGEVADRYRALYKDLARRRVRGGGR